MTAIHSEIAKWCKDGKRLDKRYLIVVCDTFDYDNYPIYVTDNEKFWDIFKQYDRKNMQKIDEIYDLNMDIESQLSEVRAYHPPTK